MKIQYDRSSLSWYQSKSAEVVTMGGNHKMISFANSGPEDVSFELRLQDGHIGPLIGILTARKRNGTIAGNGPLFINLQKKLISQDGISFIFTIDGVKDEFIEGYTFIATKNNWVKLRFPFPDLVYNRIPFRKSEKNVEYQGFFSALKKRNIPYFNPCFIDKYELYCLLEPHPILQPFLPKTILANDKRTLSAFLKKHKSIYLKPAQSSRGKGIFRLKIESNNQVILEGINETSTFQSFAHFWEEWEIVLQEKHYISQEEIKSLRYQGKRFDFRILVHADNEGYTVTGIGLRQSQDQEITTHIPSGGRLLPYQLLQTAEHDHFIQTAVNHVGAALTEAFGYFGEFSIDAGISETGDYYLYEVNSKPMSFDEIEIEERKIEQICQLFFHLTNFQMV
jgi:hypothetical protein